MFTKVSPLFLLLATVAVPVKGQELGCFPPVRPFVLSDRRDVEAYSDLIRQDFETYIVDFEAYLRCLDTERARVFAEGQEVIREYGAFQELTRQFEWAD